MFVIQLSTLQEFLVEVPAPADVRLTQSYITRNGGGPGATRDLCLDLMARRTDEIIWLHEQISLQMTPGQDEPWTENGKAVQAAFPGLIELVRAALTAQGYLVKAGRYGIPADFHPLNGQFECARWDKETQRFTAVEEVAQ